jgi:putative endonuclease
MEEHRSGSLSVFTSKYNINKLLFVQEFNYIDEALSSEKIIKGWKRFKKIDLIRTINPDFKDLLADIYKNNKPL